MSAIAPGGATDKYTAVQAMFGRIAGRYDLMNTLMTGGMDRRWRRLTIEAAALPPGGLALDVGTGTGDLAIAMAQGTPDATIVGLDYTAPMLRRAPAKARARGVAHRTRWSLGDGQHMPFPAGTFDAVTSAFVLRNFVDLGAALAEMARVTRPGGRVVALEIAPDGAPVWRQLFAWAFRHVVPRVGSAVTGEADAYRYLPASVAAFFEADAVSRQLAAAGLTPLPPRRLLLGSVLIHAGVKPEPRP